MSTTLAARSRNELRAAQWRMLFLTMLCYSFFYTARQNFGFAAKGLHTDLGFSASKIGTLSAALLLCYSVGQAINGGLGDRHGARYLVAFGALSSVALNWAFSFTDSYLSLLFLWGANGYCQSCGWAPSCRLLANWWPAERRGTAFGLLLFSAGFSSVLTFSLCLWVLRYSDWRGVFRFPVLLLAVAGIIFMVFARNSPRDAGFLIQDEDRVPPPSRPMESWITRYRAILRNGSFVVATLSLGCESVARYGLLYWVPVRFLGTDWRQNPEKALVTLSLPLGMAAGAAFTGYTSDTMFHGSRIKPIACILGLAGFVTALLAVVPTNLWAVNGTLLALAGFLVYGPQAAYWALCADIVGAERCGTAIGMMNATAYAFAAVGEVIIGHTIDRFGTIGIFYVVPIACALGVMSILAVRRVSK